jgi:hypothetical protein
MVEEATRFHRSGGTGQLFDDDNDRIIEGTADNTDTHVDVFAHGNQAQVGDYDVSGLKTALGRWKDTLSLAAIHSVTLHSCESGTEHPTSGRRYGDLLHESFREGQEYVDVTGFSGETVTDRTGATRVLKEGKKLKEWNRQSRLLEGEALGILEDDYLEPEGTGKIRFGDQALDMYSAPADPYGDPEEERAKRVEETRKQLSWIKTEMEVPEEIVIGGRPTQLPSGHRPLGQ